MLTDILIKLFIKESPNSKSSPIRLSYGVLAGIVGVILNTLLCATKLTIGIISGSVAVAADAINNLSDAGSAIVTLVGFKLASQPADKKHPFGHGRIEYVAGLIVAVIIIAVGLNFLKESIMRIITPHAIKADTLIIGILSGTLLFKLWLFFFYRKIGKKINSPTIAAAAFDSLSDLLITSLVILSMVLSYWITYPIDGYTGVIVAILVIIGGGGILRDTINPLLGECPSESLVTELKERLLDSPHISGVHDIIIHNYGPGRYFATAHAEVDQCINLMQMHNILEQAEINIAQNMPIKLLLHCDPFDQSSANVKTWRARFENIISKIDPNFKLYDFRIDDSNEEIKINFHLLIPRNYSLDATQISELINAESSQYEAHQLDIKYIHTFI